jgi:hypothetical protein
MDKKNNVKIYEEDSRLDEHQFQNILSIVKDVLATKTKVTSTKTNTKTFS